MLGQLLTPALASKYRAGLKAYQAGLASRLDVQAMQLVAWSTGTEGFAPEVVKAAEKNVLDNIRRCLPCLNRAAGKFKSLFLASQFLTIFRASDSARAPVRVEALNFSRYSLTMRPFLCSYMEPGRVKEPSGTCQWKVKACSHLLTCTINDLLALSPSEPGKLAHLMDVLLARDRVLRLCASHTPIHNGSSLEVQKPASHPPAPRTRAAMVSLHVKGSGSAANGVL